MTKQIKPQEVRDMEPEPMTCGICGCEVGEGYDDFEIVEDDGGEGPVCTDCYQEYCTDSGNGCPECERSYGPNFTGPCTEH